MRQPPFGRSRWWSRSRGLPASAYASWQASWAARSSRTPRILAWAETLDGFCIGTPGALSYQRDEAWHHLGWHEIERGGWDAETSRLSWLRYDGTEGSVGLDQPGRVPELFRERVSASIAVEKFVALVGERGVTITARRDLGNESEITWHSSLTRGLTWQTEGVGDAVDAAVAELRTEYGLG